MEHWWIDWQIAKMKHGAFLMETRMRLLRIGSARARKRSDPREVDARTETLATANALQAVIADEGILLKMGNGSYKTNPAQKSLEVARNQAARLFTEFGLTPKARNYVTPAPGPAGNNPYDYDDFE